MSGLFVTVVDHVFIVQSACLPLRTTTVHKGATTHIKITERDRSRSAPVQSLLPILR